MTRDEYVRACIDLANAYDEVLDKYHDALKANTALLDGNTSGCNWISVSDPQKPNENELVLVYTKDGVWYCQTYCNGFLRNVTHWMRIVKPSK